MKHRFVLSISVLLLLLVGCRDEELVKGNRYTFVGSLAADYLYEHEETFSDFIYILQRSNKMSLLRAYGQYTCFAPTNEAVERFLVEQDSIWRTSLQPGSKREVWTGVTSPVLEDLTDSMCMVIANTHILPEEYMTPDIVGDVIMTKNLNDRYLTVRFDTDEDLHSQIFINESLILVPDQEVENGVVHVMNAVMNPTSKLLAGAIEDMPFLSLFSEALLQTELDHRLQEYEDPDYHGAGMYVPDWLTTLGGNIPTPYIPTHYTGYTAFCESDQVFNAMGIYTVDDLYRQCQIWYPEATNPDFTKEDNALYKFMAYHLMDRKLPYSRLVCYQLSTTYWNSESNFAPNAERMEFFETLQGTTLMISRPLGDSRYRQHILLNYHKDFRNGSDKFSCTAGKNNIPVNILIYNPLDIANDKEHYPAFNQEALNGSIHIINHPLVYDEDVMAGYVLNRIIRVDAAALIPELAVNGILYAGHWYDQYGSQDGYYVPHNFSKNVKFFSEDTRLFYCCAYQDWFNYRGDEINVQGGYDFAYKLPPVPPGTYEVRMGYTARSYRGIVQFYLDDEVTGIPQDLRFLCSDPRIGWVSDKQTTDNGVMNDKELKNRGYLKGPTTYKGCILDYYARDDPYSIRKVLATKYLGPGEHWLRFKNVFEQDNGTYQFMHDYIELVPVSWLRREDISLKERRE